LSGAYLLLKGASYDGEIVHADAYRPHAGHLLGFMSIWLVVTKMTFFNKFRHIRLQFCSDDGSVGWLAGCMQGRYSDLASVSLSD